MLKISPELYDVVVWLLSKLLTNFFSSVYKMRKPDLNAATEAAAAVTVATDQREVQSAVTDSQVRVVSHRVLPYVAIVHSMIVVGV